MGTNLRISASSRLAGVLLATVSMGALGSAEAQTTSASKPDPAPQAKARPSQPRSQPAPPTRAATDPAASSDTSTASPEARADDIIVTGVGAATSARKANVAYSVINADDMSKFTPISADDMLRDMPGVVVETNDGVARNEVYTRGMTIGTGSNTSGYFWTTILEDGLPVVPFKFGGFQDGYFYRNDISTSRVESVRGGSSATAISTSVGATFNYITGPVKAGGTVQTRIGFEGDDLHLSWKQIDGQYGWLNKDGDFGIGVSGFYRTSNGQVSPGFDVNHGGQFRARATKQYTTDNGSGMLVVGYKHLDDTNAALTAFAQPVYGPLTNNQEIPGFGRDANLFLNGGQQTVPNYFKPGTHSLDPSDNFRYRQDATSLNWTHSTDNGWTFASALRLQKTTYRGQGYLADTPVSLTASNAERERYGLNINNLDRTPGFYEFRDDSGNLLARVANNVAGSQLGTNYRTGAACPRVTATTFQSNSLCVTYNGLPNRDINVGGGTVTATTPLANGTYPSVTFPIGTSSQDYVLRTRIEDTYRSSNDILANFSAGHETRQFGFNVGLYFARSKEINQSWANGQGLSAWADGQVRNLNVTYVTQAGTVYKLTDPGGWGYYGTGLFGTQNQSARITEIAPRAELRWSPTPHWDFNASVKYDHFAATTYSASYNVRNAAAGSLTNGGLDGNPLTVYDNLYSVLNTAQVIQAKHTVGVFNWSAALGYNINRNHKFYFRYTDGKQPANGIIARYPTAATLVRPLGPTAYVKGYEIAYTFDTRRVNGAITYFKQNFAVNDYPTGIAADNTSTYLLPDNFNRYFTRGIEAWMKLRITRAFEWSPSVTFLNGRTQAAYNWLNTGANGQGPADDVLRIDSGGLARTPKWDISNIVSYRIDNVRLNLRYRFLSARRLAVSPVDLRTLPKQDNLDASVDWEPRRGTRMIFDVRNVFNKQYISAYDAVLGTNLPSGIQAYDVIQQLPNTTFLLRRNPPRSMWLTVRQDF